MTIEPARQRVPRTHGRGLVGVARRLQATLLAGDAVECPCCGRTFRRFMAYGQPRRPGARCASCGSLERHRATWLYLTRVAGILDGPKRVLDVAPAPFVSEALLRVPSVDYLSIDLESPLAMRHLDVTALDLTDATFDVLMCSHVLEHVPDDQAAMRELYRVLRPGGVAMLQTPWDPQAAATDEDPTVTGEAERVRRFGQADHVRIYGRDLFDRLTQAGWIVEVIEPAATFGDAAVVRYGLATDDPLIVGRRPA